MTDLAGFAVSMGSSLSAAVDKLKREQVQVTPPPPPPPPPPDGSRIRIAEKKALPPHKPPGSMPGSSNDPPPPPPPGQFRFGNENMRGPPAKKKKSEMDLMDAEDKKLDKAMRAKPKPKAAPTLVKQRDKKDPGVGVKKEATVPDHDQKLTKHGVKPVLHKKKESEDTPTLHVEASKTEYRPRQRKGAPPPPITTILRKRPMEAGRPAKRHRYISAHELP